MMMFMIILYYIRAGTTTISLQQ